ncbi:UDP-N-acetylmuramoyl-L-alanyl-D-glutamate--2,6-diaminopimelate ligase [Xenophilus sp. Marseille-Q4582]|uniref:UDP-N-acetylmuramoyl-L-alanyl-D-glutamate--2, 6-diaminopimelate ligase n=1 Tax=Xenophilus sp. Marseille-Q4582 TaxID=2866600 RepID=UPI001CE4824D|nr:UDP-N-acetylmuramoyl-L-alanyl-D-glutamate--2,6-diaminopimelate ligase [Xenophilus sp. Marseille-Q4582]
MALQSAFLQPLFDVDSAVQWLRARGAKALRVDSRAVQPGDAFIAWPGAATDGRAYVQAALAQGAVACLVEAEGVDTFDFGNGEGTLAAVASYAGLKAATGPIAAAWCNAPSQALDLLAVTGTNGKTSTAWWLAQALNAGAAQPQCALIGTLGVGVPPELTYTGLTTPDPVTLQQSLRGFVDQGFSACAIEASSIGIAERRLDGTRIAVAVFTNFTQDHLDYHANMDAYWQAKAELFRWPGLRAAVVNIDDLRGAALVQELLNSGARGLDLWTTSAQGRPARLSAQGVGYGSQGLQFDVVEQGLAPARLATRLTGDYNVANLLGVIGALRARGLALREAVAACAGLDSVPGRMELVPAPGPNAPLAVVDYAHTPDALDKVLTGLRAFADQRGGRLWCVFGCGGDRDPVKRPLMAAVAETRADAVVLTSDNPRSESPAAILAQILRGFANPDAVQVQPDRARAIADALAQAAPADVVLIAGKGHEAWQEIAGERHPFSDRAHALAALQARGTA